jgi:WD40 repeat protein
VDGQVGIWENGVLEHTIDLNDGLLSIASHEDLMAFGTNSGDIIVWDISGNRDDWSEVAVLEGHTNRISALDFNADGTRLVSASRDGSLIIWDMSSYSALTAPLIGHNDAVETVRFNPSGTIIASGSRDTRIILWSAETGEPLGPALVNHENWVNDITFSPDGRLMLSVSGDQSMIIWSVEHQRAIGLPFLGHTNWVNSVSASVDNTRVITGGRDGMLIKWDIDFESWMNSACSIASRDLTDGEIRDFFNEVYPPNNVCSSNQD